MMKLRRTSREQERAREAFWREFRGLPVGWALQVSDSESDHWENEDLGVVVSFSDDGRCFAHELDDDPDNRAFASAESWDQWRACVAALIASTRSRGCFGTSDADHGAVEGRDFGVASASYIWIAKEHAPTLDERRKGGRANG